MTHSPGLPRARYTFQTFSKPKRPSHQSRPLNLHEPWSLWEGTPGLCHVRNPLAMAARPSSCGPAAPTDPPFALQNITACDSKAKPQRTQASTVCSAIYLFEIQSFPQHHGMISKQHRAGTPR